MKTAIRFSFLTLLALALFHLGFAEERAQLWGSMINGGNGGVGVLYNLNSDGTPGNVAIHFDGYNRGANPSGNLIQGPNNILYGTTLSGGHHGCGVLFKYDPTNGAFEVLHHFTGALTGRTPKDLFLGNDEKLYGTTQEGGNGTSATAPMGCGVIYSFDITGQGGYNKIMDFDGINGENPQGLMQASNGVLYGMTRQGGTHERGVLYSYSQNSGFSVLKNFHELDGELPTNCNLMQVGTMLFGMTTWGGSKNMGVVFSYDIIATADPFNVIHHFDGSDGSFPSGTLMQADNGKLYGMTAYGGTYDQGIIFSYNIGLDVYTALHSFNGSNGSTPYGSLIQASDELLYGVTTEGGNNGTGVIFNFNTATDQFTIVRHCDGAAEGIRPMGNLLEFEPSTSTGIADVSSDMISIYPNPTIDKISVRTTTTPEVISVLDVNGSKVLEVKNVSTVDLTPLARGSYFIQVNDRGTISRSRLFKQ